MAGQMTGLLAPSMLVVLCRTISASTAARAATVHRRLAGCRAVMTSIRTSSGLSGVTHPKTRRGLIRPLISSAMGAFVHATREAGQTTLGRGAQPIDPASSPREAARRTTTATLAEGAPARCPSARRH